MGEEEEIVEQAGCDGSILLSDRPLHRGPDVGPLGTERRRAGRLGVAFVVAAGLVGHAEVVAEVAIA